MKRWTIRARLTLLYGGLFLVAGAILLGVTYLLVQQSLEARLGPGRGAIDLRAARATGEPGVMVRLSDGREVTAAEAVEAFRAEQEQFRQDTLDSLLTRGGIALLGVGVVAGAFGWLVAGRALQPVHQITDTARRIAAADSAGKGLHERIALSGPRDEVKELADTFDSMLERLDRSFDGQRRFVANASHEMRTPLALNRALVELAVSRPGAPEELVRLGEQLLAVNERHERLIDGLLMLADSENAVTERSTVDLSEVVGHVLEQTDTRGLAVESTVDPVWTAGDPVLLERLVQNLFENAVRHNTPAGGTVSVTTAVVDGRARLVVSNTGPVVPRYEIETLFQPFRRLNGERLGGGPPGGRGFGLGLSIVRAIARAHGGTVTAEPRDGGGLVVTVTLPPAPTIAGAAAGPTAAVA